MKNQLPTISTFIIYTHKVLYITVYILSGILKFTAAVDEPNIKGFSL